MSHLTTELVLKALDGLYERASVTAENIANAGAPNYRPLRVSFEAALAQAAFKGPDAVKAVHPQIERDPTQSAASGVRLDLEVATATATAMRYAALIEIIGRRGQLDEIARSGNA